MSADGLGIGDGSLGGASGGVVTLPFPAPAPAVVPGLGRPKRGDWACHKVGAVAFASFGSAACFVYSVIPVCA